MQSEMCESRKNGYCKFSLCAASAAAAASPGLVGIKNSDIWLQFRASISWIQGEMRLIEVLQVWVFIAIKRLRDGPR